MNVSRGEVWWASLDPTLGSEQAGRRPVLVIQNDAINRFTSTVLAIPLTANLRRAQLPSSVLLPRGAAGLPEDSVVLCHQLRVLDSQRLTARIGSVDQAHLLQVEAAILFTIGIDSGAGEPA